MSLALKPNSKWWYARPQIHGTRLFVNLQVEVRGRPPASLRELGDEAFEDSRRDAQAAFNLKFGPKVQHSLDAEYHRQMYQMLTGRALRPREPLHLADLVKEWDAIPRGHAPSEKHVEQCRQAIREFVELATADGQTLSSEVDGELVAKWVNAMQGTVGARTINFKLQVLRGLFGKIRGKTGMDENPFAAMPRLEENTHHREPFTKDELAKIVAAADPVTRGPIVTAMATAMRRGDCCLLKWSEVDLKSGFIVVKTSKTGETAEIPILPILREELVRAARQKSGAYVWPEAALMIRSNPEGVSKRVKQAIVAAGAAPAEPKAKPVRRAKKTGEGDDAAIVAVPRARKPRRASVKDFHSFRTTWITMALAAGVPMELVRRVTGHATVEIVLKHYFRPGREDFKKAIGSAMDWTTKKS